MKFKDTGWEKLDTLSYSRRLTAYLNRVNSGIDRDDEDASVAYVKKLFHELDDAPLDVDALARDETTARKLEDGE